MEVPLWGAAEPGEKVTVTVGGKSAETTAGQDGKWRVTVGPLMASTTPIEVTVKGTNEIVYRDVLVGEVWVCSGQSNMAFPLSRVHNAAEALPAANVPTMRLFNVGRKLTFEPQTEIEGEWQVCTPETSRGFSAVGYFFGRDLSDQLKVPVGLIGSSWGGTPAEAWTSLEGLKVEPSLASHIEKLTNLLTNREEILKTYRDTTIPKWEEAVKEWKAAAEVAKSEGREPQPKSAPRRPPQPDNDPHTPTVLYNGMIAPLIPYGMRGAIWYQGESNAGRAKEYETLFPAMIRDWRRQWAQGDFPFLFVQLAAYGDADVWAQLRNAQFKTLSLPKTGMAVALDVGEKEDIHPLNKEAVGARLALAARSIAYGEDVVFSGPLFKTATPDGCKMHVSFDSVGGGLVIGRAPAIRVDQEPAAALDHLVGFEVAGADGKFVAAQATIEGDQVAVWNDEVKSPTAVRYGWSASPQVNLYNKEGLPASSFSSAEAP